MLLLAWFSGVAIGMLFLGLKPWAPGLANIVQMIFTRTNMIASGKMFVANAMPGYLRRAVHLEPAVPHHRPGARLHLHQLQPALHLGLVSLVYLSRHPDGGADGRVLHAQARLGELERAAVMAGRFAGPISGRFSPCPRRHAGRLARAPRRDRRGGGRCAQHPRTARRLAPVIGSLAPDATGIEVIRPNERLTWGLVNAGERTGWVSLRYLERRPGQWDGAFPEIAACYGTEPFWGLSRAGDTLTYSDPETEALELPIVARSGSANRRDSFHIVAEGPDGPAVAFLRTESCGDGMSDREFGISVQLLLGIGAEVRHLSGCCTLAGQ
jgi:uncharacterized membrane protein